MTREGVLNSYKSFVSADVLATLVADERALAVDLYQAIRKQSGNLFYSPYSIYVALSMPYVGARGQTALQMSKTLHFSLPGDDAPLYPAVESLGLELKGRGLLDKGQGGQILLRLKVANMMWGQAGYQFLQDNLFTLEKHYQATFPTFDQASFPMLDFAAASAASSQTISAWVKDQTEGKIPDLLSAGTIGAMTKLVLANAIHFDVAWKNPFSPTATKTMPFRLLDGSSVDVPTMSDTLTLPYAKGQGYQAVELRYDGDGLGLVILLPDAGTFEQFEQGLTVAKLQDALSALAPNQVVLSLPKLRYEPRIDLGQTLKGLGMTDAFDASKADFTEMTDRRGLSIGDVVHKAIISLDENGSEAAAATGVAMGLSATPHVEAATGVVTQPTAAPRVEATVVVDRPFVFLIRDVKTGAVVFLGRVTNPIA